MVVGAFQCAPSGAPTQWRADEIHLNQKGSDSIISYTAETVASYMYMCRLSQNLVWEGIILHVIFPLAGRALKKAVVETATAPARKCVLQ